MTSSLFRDSESSLSLLGTIHALPANEYPLSEAVEAAYELCRTVVLEASPDATLDQSLGTLPGGWTLKKLLAPDLYDRLRLACERLDLDLEKYGRLRSFA